MLSMPQVFEQSLFLFHHFFLGTKVSEAAECGEKKGAMQISIFSKLFAGNGEKGLWMAMLKCCFYLFEQIQACKTYF